MGGPEPARADGVPGAAGREQGQAGGPHHHQRRRRPAAKTAAARRVGCPGRDDGRQRCGGVRRLVVVGQPGRRGRLVRRRHGQRGTRGGPTTAAAAAATATATVDARCRHADWQQPTASARLCARWWRRRRCTIVPAAVSAGVPHGRAAAAPVLRRWRFSERIAERGWRGGSVIVAVAPAPAASGHAAPAQRRAHDCGGPHAQPDG